jgi:predicted transcriptional regulator
MTIQDKAYELMTIKANLLEVTLGERTNVETIKEGRTSFIYKVWFCNSNNKIKTRIINISLKGY